MKLFIADIGQGTVHIFDSANDIFYPKQPLEILKNLEIPNIERGDALIVEDAHLRSRVEGGKSLAHPFDYSELKQLYLNAHVKGIALRLFPQGKSATVRRLWLQEEYKDRYDAAREAIKKGNKVFLEKFGMTTDECDCRAIAKFLQREPEAFKRLKYFEPIRQEDFQNKQQHVYDYVGKANIDINTARTQGYGFDDWEGDAVTLFLKKNRTEIVNRLIGDGIFDLDSDRKFEGRELLELLGFKHFTKKNEFRYDKHVRAYTVVSSILTPEGELRNRTFPPGHKYEGVEDMFPEWKYVKANFFGIKPFHQKSGVGSSNYKMHMRTSLSNLICIDENGKDKKPKYIPNYDSYLEFKKERSIVDKKLHEVWKVLKKMIVDEGIR